MAALRDESDGLSLGREAEDRLLDDIERYEPGSTHLDIGGNDPAGAVVGALCLAAVGLVLIGCGVVLVVRWAVGG